MELPHIGSHLEIIGIIFGSSSLCFTILVSSLSASLPGPSLFNNIVSHLAQKRMEKRPEQKSYTGNIKLVSFKRIGD